MVRPGAGVVLRLRPRGGGALLPAGGRARSRLRDGPVGDRLRRRPLLQQAVEQVRPGRPRGHPGRGPHRHPAGAGAHREHEPGGAGAHRSARAALSLAGAGRRLRPVERRLRRCDARGVPLVPGRPGRMRAVRRGAHEPHPLGLVGPRDGRAGRGRGHPGSARGARRRHERPGSGGRAGPPRPAAHVPARPGDVPASGAGVARGRPPARPRARRRPPAAHAHPHRRPVRGLPRDGGVERPRRRRRPEILRARGPRTLVHALLRPQLPLHALRGDAPRPPPGRDGGDGGPAGGPPRAGAPGGEPADGGLAGRLRGDAGARAHPLRPMARDPRHAAAAGSGPLLHDDRDAALRQGARARGAGGRARGAGRAGAFRGRGGPGARHPHRVQQHLPRHPGDRRADAWTAR